MKKKIYGADKIGTRKIQHKHIKCKSINRLNNFLD